MCQLKARSKTLKSHSTISRLLYEFLKPWGNFFFFLHQAHKMSSAHYYQYLCYDDLSPSVSPPLCFFIYCPSLCFLLSHICAGIAAALCWFQVLHRKPHQKPRWPEPEASPDLSTLQQNHWQTRPDLGKESQRQWRWWGQVWYGRTPVHLTWHLARLL